MATTSTAGPGSYPCPVCAAPVPPAAAPATATDDARTLDQRRSDVLYDLVTGRAEPPQIQLNITVPAAVLTGTSSDPGELSGYGPVSADRVRDLIGEPSTFTCGPQIWQRLVTDPVTGVLTDISEKRYRPSAALNRAVRARDVTCRFPGCRRSALTTRNGVDLDHTKPWPAGETSADNLACLCRHHHRLKHSPGWHALLARDGTMKWTTPAGRTFFTTPWSYHDPPDSTSTTDTDTDVDTTGVGDTCGDSDHRRNMGDDGDQRANGDDGDEAADAA